MAKILAAAALLVAWTPLSASAQASGQARLDPAYATQLQNQKMASPDADFCSKFTGNAYNACKVTRNYIAQINNGTEKKGSYPPPADGSYTRDDGELNKLADRLPNN